MKTHLFNSLEVNMLGLSRSEGSVAVDLFFDLVEDFGMEQRVIYKPKTLCNMKLIGGDETDFKTILDLVREQLRNKWECK